MVSVIIKNGCQDCESGKGHRPLPDDKCSFCSEYLRYGPEFPEDGSDEDIEDYFEDYDDTYAVCCGHVFECLGCLGGGHPVGYGSTPECIRCGEMHRAAYYTCCGHRQRYVHEDDNEFGDVSDDDDYEEDDF